MKTTDRREQGFVSVYNGHCTQRAELATRHAGTSWYCPRHLGTLLQAFDKKHCTPRAPYQLQTNCRTGVQWEREASGLLQSHLRVEQEKEWKRRRHELLRNDEAPLDELDPYARQEIEQQRARVSHAARRMSQ